MALFHEAIAMLQAARVDAAHLSRRTATDALRVGGRPQARSSSSTPQVLFAEHMGGSGERWSYHKVAKGSSNPLDSQVVQNTDYCLRQREFNFLAACRQLCSTPAVAQRLASSAHGGSVLQSPTDW
eukprot:CAMPEP_0203887324 /NCGR_PEP_ID=MMETSP0359-20131031/31044_1 /ASSEMBLY_ACC=CAM_ASM_000338 /TAXON_ID=268821 /ORGANISM="Scrippsiella Hangoei, Strain SHTV-5" /LENGTH=125 /DNA_ID=CAMNT_0050808315 /DNA_START=64 /DNA_END=438 /DNA_ORIENTATION=+